MVEIGERAGSGMDKIFGGWEWAGYGEPGYDVAYGPDRTTLTLPLVSADSTGVSTAEGRPKAAETGFRGPRPTLWPHSWQRRDPYPPPRLRCQLVWERRGPTSSSESSSTRGMSSPRVLRDRGATDWPNRP